ncbi:MAG: helix-turn-helix domain-containing protein [Candidatus Lokiarchaeota archaeon]|nr:helix-turn-helix domain-containing protein [Candidatus Harpocratesius repetitus]
MSSCENIVGQTIQILQNYRYQVFEYQDNFDLCFEILARHHSPRSPNLLIKIVDNIDSIRNYYLNELKIVSHLIQALPLLIASRNRHSLLEDGSIYLRDGLVSLNFETFSNVIKNPQIPIAIAKQGGLFYNIDGEKLARLRENRQISRKNLAEKLGVSTKAISQYEKNRMRASSERAKKMEDILGESIILPLDFYLFIKDTLSSIKLNDSLQRRITKKTEEFMKEINEIVADTGFKVYWTRSSPFDLFIYEESDEDLTKIQYKLVGGTQMEEIESDKNSDLKRQFLPNISIHKVDGAIIFNDEIFNEKKARKYKVPYLFPKELRELEYPEKFHKKIRKRAQY